MPTFRAAVILAVFLIVTLILIPVQWLGVTLRLPYIRTLPLFYHRFVAWLFGIRIRVVGAPAKARGVLLLANHTGWMDIVIFSAVLPVSFVAKAEVGSWPFFGTLARLQRTVFVERAKRSETGVTRDVIRDRLLAGDTLMLFPEGTSSDGNEVLSFKSALLGAAEISSVTVQPVSTAYTGIHGIPMGRENRPLFAWYGDMELVPHLWEALKAGPLDVVVQFHPPLQESGRKELAKAAEKLVREGQVRAWRDTLEMTAPPADNPRMKKLFIKTYGCQMNTYDSARMADLLAPLGYGAVETPDGADMVILNTCHIREKAAEKVYSELGRLKALKRDTPGMQVVVAGCVAQAEGQEIVRRAPVVDMVVGPQSYHRLPEMIARHAREQGHVLEADFPALEKFDHLPEAVSDTGISAFLTVQEGCDKFCTFCVVPYTRGPEHSRAPERILAEARALTARGAREITLLGQNVNAYRGTDENGVVWNLARLVRALADLKTVWRIRYTTSHPRDMDGDLITAHGAIEKLMPFLHLPVQSGSDTVLAAMNRQHTADDYLGLVEKLRASRPDIAFSSDFIVGFPGESDADFEATMALVRTVKFAQCFSFKYSPRPGTPAAAAKKQISEAAKNERLQALQALLLQQQDEANLAAIGKTMPVLFEKSGRDKNQLVGRSPWLQPVHAEGPTSLIGTIAPVKVARLTANSLHGALTESIPA